jgi:hypothetical protein
VRLDVVNRGARRCVAPLPYLLAAGAGTLVAAIVAAMVAAAVAVAVAPFAVGGVIGLRNGRSLVLS